ncbi:hypothetical protein [Amazonocrinis nigriterrae]|uniref:hypothetical protein n=1 Tax=Amazonocrinis nigriterrae TaxID=2840443 RepID=UPI001CEC5F0D|nr:hypothetical protein [Amazonocrinis nigriterrae]
MTEKDLAIMSTTTPSKVEFLQYNQDVMEIGIYEIEVEQTITSSKIDQQLQPFTCKMTFVVSGERFGPLSPSDIYAVFPPQDSLGEHHYVVPHITLKRSTLPWERFPGTSDEELPWLVLLLLRETDFDNEQDKPKLQSLTLKDLLATPDTIKFPQITLELGGQHEQEAVTVIDVKKKYLQPVLPTKADLAYLAHARQPKDAEGNPQGEQLATLGKLDGC